MGVQDPAIQCQEPTPFPELVRLGRVRDHGGGCVIVFMDRDSGNLYPPIGTDVWVAASVVRPDPEPDDDELQHWPGDGPDMWRTGSDERPVPASPALDLLVAEQESLFGGLRRWWKRQR